MNDHQRDIALVRYSLIREAADPTLSKRERGELVPATGFALRGADSALAWLVCVMVVIVSVPTWYVRRLRLNSAKTLNAK